MSKREEALRAVVVGLNRGRALTRALVNSGVFKLEALCDIDEERAKKVAEMVGSPPVYTEYGAMLREIKPDVVVIATPTDLHAPMTFQAIEAGAKGIYCEKPMATNLKDAKAMVDTCREKGIALVVGHQRRMGAVYGTMRKLIEEGALGDIYLIRGACPGDLLSDATHTMDSIRFLNGDSEVKWALGQIHREKPSPGGFTGVRYGHVIESGAFAVFEFANGVRAELLVGDMRFGGWQLPHPGWAYQDIEVFGTKGRLWRNGDMSNPPLRIFDEKGGWREVEIDRSSFGMPEQKTGERPENMHGATMHELVYVFKEFQRYILEGGTHPLNGENALKGFEVLMAIFESARLRKKIALPIQQERYPLEIMIEEGLI